MIFKILALSGALDLLFAVIQVVSARNRRRRLRKPPRASPTPAASEPPEQGPHGPRLRGRKLAAAAGRRSKGSRSRGLSETAPWDENAIPRSDAPPKRKYRKWLPLGGSLASHLVVLYLLPLAIYYVVIAVQALASP